eukprot:RCo044975
MTLRAAQSATDSPNMVTPKMQSRKIAHQGNVLLLLVLPSLGESTAAETMIVGNHEPQHSHTRMITGEEERAISTASWPNTVHAAIKHENLKTGDQAHKKEM